MAPDNPHDCPFCRTLMPLGGVGELIDHLLDCHAKYERDGNKSLYVSVSGKSVRCWCGGWYNVRGQQHFNQYPRWDEHLEKEGGPAAHFLRVALGVKAG